MTRLLLFFLLLGGVLRPVLSQDRHKDSGQPVVGLVLSGGGVKGVAHIPLIEAIEDLGIPIDLVVGTSVGSVVGGLYASGYSASEIHDVFESADWTQLITDTPNRRALTMEEKLLDGRFVVSLPVRRFRVGLPSGLIAGQRVSERLSRLTWPVHHVRDFAKLPIPFACLATDIETGEGVRLEKGVLAEAIRASMSFPSVFAPVKLEDRLLVDGGVVRNLPAQDARELGADFLICSDVSKRLHELDELDSIISIMEQTFNFNYWATVEEQRAMCDIVIAPDVDEHTTFAFREIDEILAAGKSEVARMMDDLRQIADTLSRPGAQQLAWIPARVDSVEIDHIEISGLEDVPETVVRGQMDLPESGLVSADAIDRDIDRVFSTRFFERVTYDLQPNSQGSTTLHIRTSERTEDEMRLGFRYDIRDQGRFLVNTTFRNVASRGSKLSVEAEVGNKLSLTANYVVKAGKRRRVGAFVRSQVLKSRFEEYLDAEPVAQISFRAARSEVGFGSVFSTRLHAGISVLAEYSHTAPRITELPDEEARTVFTLMPVATLWIDSFDRAAFPTRGTFLYARSLAAHTDFGSDVSMSQHRVIGMRASRLHPRVVLTQELELAITYGDRSEIPGPWRLGLGGENKGLYETGRFVGLDLNERTGKYLAKVAARVRFEVQPRRYLTFIANVGSARDEWGWNVFEDNVITGFGIGAGLDTVIGPIDMVLSAGNTNDVAVSFNLGYRFATTY